MNSLSRIGDDLHHICGFLSDSSVFTSVSIHEDAHGIQIEKTIFGANIFAPNKAESTIAYFQKIFGQRRVVRICHNIGIEFLSVRWAMQKIFGQARGANMSHSMGTEFLASKWAIQNFFVSTGELFEEDFEDLLGEIKGTTPRVRALSDADTDVVRGRFEQVRTLRDCSKAQLDLLYQILVPFARIEDIFFGHFPDCSIRALDSGKNFTGLRTRVYMYEQFRRDLLSYDQKLMLLAKKFPLIVPDIGTVFPGLNGTLEKVHGIAQGGGACKIFLETIGREAQNEGHYVLYRCTTVAPTRDCLDTILDDLRPSPGQNGAAATDVETRRLMQSPPFNHAKLSAIAYSLGCCHAAYDSIAHPIHRAIMVAPMGVDHRIAALFRERLEPMTLDYYLEAHDVVDQMGQELLGSGCRADRIRTRIHVLMAGNMPRGMLPQDTIEAIAIRRKIFGQSSYILNAIRASGHLVWALMSEHIRLTPFQPYSAVSISNEDQAQLVDAILSRRSNFADPQWEVFRQGVAKILF